MQKLLSPYSQTPRPIRLALLLIGLLLVSYAYIYQTAPLPGIWTDIYLNLMIVAPSLLAAMIASQVWRSFQPGEGPRYVWFAFALALWSWGVAEIIWFTIWLIQGDVPNPSPADFFWLVALVPFAAAFLLQYRLIFRTTRALELRWMRLAVLGTLLLTLAGTWLLHDTTAEISNAWGQTFLDVFYAAADLAMLVAALGLARAFGRGMWGRAWWGLLAFVISDALYSYVTISGLYSQSVDSGNLLTLVVDSVYALAYMLVSLACWTQLLLVRHGPSLEKMTGEEFTDNATLLN